MTHKKKDEKIDLRITLEVTDKIGKAAGKVFF